MSKWFIVFCLILNSCLLQAHQPDLSSTMLIERENGDWILQVRAALTAFQYEVKAQYGEDSYDTPEKFQELAIKHLQENLFIYFNEQDTAALLQNPFIKLGHETNAVFKVLGVPKTLKTVSVKNSSFKDIYKNQSALIILKEGFAKEQFVLNNDNQHTAQLLVEESKFVLQTEKMNKPVSYFIFIAITIGLLTLGMSMYLWTKFKQRRNVYS